MNKISIISILLSALIVLGSCSQGSNDLNVFDLGDGEVQMHYDETQCSDPWYGNESIDINLSDEARTKRLINFLQGENIEVIAVAYEFDEDNVMACLACNCLSGGKYLVKIEHNEENIEKLINWGFQFD